MKTLGIITAAFFTLYLFINRQSPLIMNLSNATFIIGLIYLFIALLFYVRNIGFFKLISYHIYKRKYVKSNGFKDKEKDILELHEWVNEHYKEKWSNKKYLIFSIPLIVLSYVLAYFA